MHYSKMILFFLGYDQTAWTMTQVQHNLNLTAQNTNYASNNLQKIKILLYFSVLLLIIYLKHSYAAVSLGDGCRSVEDKSSGSCTTEFEETDMGFPSNCNIMLPSISVNSFLNSSSFTTFASSAFTILKTSPITLSICKIKHMRECSINGQESTPTLQKNLLHCIL